MPARTRARPAKKPVAVAAAPGRREVDPAFAKIVDAFARDREITVGGKFGSTSLMRRGKVFVMFMKGRFVAKLPAERVDALVSAGSGTNLVMGKRVMKEWVVISNDERGRWLPLAREAHASI
jgi:hypothetical protein